MLIFPTTIVFKGFATIVSKKKSLMHKSNKTVLVTSVMSFVASTCLISLCLLSLRLSLNTKLLLRAVKRVEKEDMMDKE